MTVEAALPCFILCSPTGPGEPFVGVMLFYDSVRVLCLLAGVLVVIAMPRCILECQTVGQRARFVAFGMFCLSAISTEYSHIGDFGSLRLLFNIAGVAAALYGTWTFLLAENPGTRRERQ